MPIKRLSKKHFSGTSKVFDGSLAEKLNELIDAANASGGGAGAGIHEKPEVVALTPIADPATADAEACATAINDIIAALKASV